MDMMVACKELSISCVVKSYVSTMPISTISVAVSKPKLQLLATRYGLHCPDKTFFLQNLSKGVLIDNYVGV